MSRTAWALAATVCLFTVAVWGTGAPVAPAGGSLYTFGNNQDGELADGSTVVRTTPAPMGVLSWTPVAVSSGSSCALALKSDGTVWAWGSNSYGLGDTAMTRLSSTPVLVEPLSGVTAVAAGGGFCFTLKSDGTVWSWGNNNSGAAGGRHRSTEVQPRPGGGGLRGSSKSPWAGSSASRSSPTEQSGAGASTTAENWATARPRTGRRQYKFPD